jgi:peptidoglycan/xylan/chitin deacetylase (PgdA/CDA1 family)
MKRIIRKNVKSAVYALPMQALAPFVSRDVICLFYHVVSDQPVPHTDHLYIHRPLELFENDLRYLALNYAPITYDALRQNREQGQQLPKKAVHLSFDDGFAECYHLVRPLLLRYNIPCTFFLTTDFIDNRRMYYRNQVSLCLEKFISAGEAEQGAILEQVNAEFGVTIIDGGGFEAWAKALIDEGQVERLSRAVGVDIPAYLAHRQPYLTREQVRELLAQGFTIGAHSQRHIKLGRLSQERAAEEILESCLAIGRMTGNAGVPFSFPNSGDGLERDFLLRLRQEHRAVGLYFDTKGLRQDRPFIVNRIWAESPKLNPGGNLALPDILRRAYQEHLLNL